ncbi:hypothetical protein TRFO_27946 [Tritrichomonas foetus]|uniref:Uncharacterized protein n=1 Tax=Tritrichomonas foetus TaxID=1144522 RepID=A0A1J4K4Y1_9EUKA|nr:hypothetical protein TRFO_27946 [Tritrichomonas foetus]|eukprot:OHT04557.1 hypothetical protein TRFO_27946 [Tritrichomonas foetus]
MTQENIKLSSKLADGVLEITGNHGKITDLRKLICTTLGVPESRFHTLVFKSLVPKTPFYDRVLKYLTFCLDIPNEDADPEEIIEFHADWMRKNLKAPNIESFNQLTIEIPYYHAALIIETLCSTQEPQFEFRYSKNYLMQKIVLPLSIVAPIPISFEMTPRQTVQLSFADTPTISAQQCRTQADFALNIFNTVKVIWFGFSKVVPFGYQKVHLEKLRDELNSTILVSDLTAIEPNGLISFGMYVLPSQPGADFRQGLVDKVKKHFTLFLNAHHCPRCDQYYATASPDQCGVYEHEGKQIPFEDGKMEHQETLDDGSIFVTVKYQCCGEIPKGQRPTEFMFFDDFHIPEDESVAYSQFQFSVQ